MSDCTDSPRAVVLLHGLFDASDPSQGPFVDLGSIEQDLIAAGRVVLHFEWPATFNPVMAMRNPRRSFSHELAEPLDGYLRQQMHTTLRGREWAIVAHSGGGTQSYRWLVDYAVGFGRDWASLPHRVVAIAAPYKCTAGRLDLPNGVRITVNEPPLEPRAIAQALPGRLVIIAASNDTTALPVDTLFPPDLIAGGLVFQHLIPGADHRNVCHRRATRTLVRAYV